MISCQKEKYDIIIKNVNIVDVEAGKIIQAKDIGITNQMITRITNANGLSPNDSTKVLDGTGKFVMPGLWDMHVHLYFPDKEYLKLYIAKGVTGIREMSGWKMKWKDSTNQNQFVPRMQISSLIMDGPAPWFKGDVPVKNCEEAVKMVKEAKRKGHDFVKLLSLVPRDQYHAIVEECQKSGYSFAGHIPFCIPTLEAAKAGQKSNEHMESILLACSSKEEEYRVRIDSLLKILNPDNAPTQKRKLIMTERGAIASFSQDKADRLIDSLSKYQMWQCPTLSVLQAHVFNQLPIQKTDGREAYFPFPPKKIPEFKTIPKPLQKARGRVKLQMKLLKQMHDKGIGILAGTDQGCAGFNLHDELAFMVNAGFTEADALRTATINPAIYTDQEEFLGSVSPNKAADLILLNSNPLENIQNTRDINRVIYRNQILDPQKLLQDVKSVNEEIVSATKKSKE
jgi:hypothetical protein